MRSPVLLVDAGGVLETPWEAQGLTYRWFGYFSAYRWPRIRHGVLGNALVDAANADFHLKSTHGHWTSSGQFQNDSVDSPALAKGDPASPVDKQAAQAGVRTELGAYGNTGEASYVK